MRNGGAGVSSKSIEELWGSWKNAFSWVGRSKGKKRNHWWDKVLHYWLRQKNWKRKQGLDHKMEKKQIRRRKRQLRRQRRKERMDKLRG